MRTESGDHSLILGKDYKSGVPKNQSLLVLILKSVGECLNVYYERTRRKIVQTYNVRRELPSRLNFIYLSKY